MAATNHELELAVAGKTFRQDLYFRLNGISLTIPPLRDRPDEIEPLVLRFIADAAAPAKRRPPRLSPEALELLVGYAWPGNIRELRNVAERALVLCDDGEITPEHLPLDKLRLLRRVPAASSPAAAAAAPDATGGIALTPAETAERQQILELLAEYALEPDPGREEARHRARHADRTSQTLRHQAPANGRLTAGRSVQSRTTCSRVARRLCEWRRIRAPLAALLAVSGVARRLRRAPQQGVPK